MAERALPAQMTCRIIDSARTPDNMIGEVVFTTVEVECDIGVLRFTINDDGDFMFGVDSWDPTDAVWATLAEAAKTAREAARVA